MSKSRIGDIFYLVNDTVEMKKFYSDIIGWEEKQFVSNEHFSHLVYQLAENLNLVIIGADKEIPVIKEWSKGPVFDQGRGYEISWTVQVTTFGDYQDLLKRIKDNNLETLHDSPIWVGNYWTFYCRDPMGRTVEVYHEPEKAPEDTIWK